MGRKNNSMFLQTFPQDMTVWRWVFLPPHFPFSTSQAAHHSLQSAARLCFYLTFIIPTSFIRIQSAAALCLTGIETNEQTNERSASRHWHLLRRVKENVSGLRCLLFGSSYCAIYWCFFTVGMAAAWSYEVTFIRHLLLEILLFAWEPGSFQFILCDAVMQFFFLLKWL